MTHCSVEIGFKSKEMPGWQLGTDQDESDGDFQDKRITRCSWDLLDLTILDLKTTCGRVDYFWIPVSALKPGDQNLCI